MSLAILADDLTGACDTGALFAGKSSVPVVVWPRRPARGDTAAVRVIDTESRALSPAEAAARVAAVVGDAGAARWFKKIDSTLRGPIGAEVDALLRATGVASAVVCPAFPALGRVVLDRTLLIDGTPVAETPLAEDPRFPGGAGATSSVIDLLRPQLDRPIAWIPIEQLRAGTGALAARLARLDGTVVIADAETDADLDRLVEAALLLDAPPLLVGAAGLAHALAARLGVLVECVELPRARRLVIVAGSRHPATRRQIDAARAAGLRVLAAPAAEQPDRAAVAARLADEARRLLEAEPFDLVAVTGGGTARALYEALGAARLDLLGAPAPGLALGTLRIPGRPPLRLLTKAGAFGPPDLFVALAHATE